MPKAKSPKPIEVFPAPYELTCSGTWDKEWMIDAGGIAVMVDHDDVDLIEAEALAYKIQLLPALIAAAHDTTPNDDLIARLKQIEDDRVARQKEYAAEQDAFNDVPDDLPGQD